MFRAEIDVRPPQCEYHGCFRTARYGPREGPMSFCQDHKRVGMYTARNGKWLVATNDGNAFRSMDWRDETGPRRDSTHASTHATKKEASDVTRERHGRQELQGGWRGGETKSSKSFTRASGLGGSRTERAAPGDGDSRAQGMNDPEQRGPSSTPDQPCSSPGCRKRAAYGAKRGLSKPVFCGDHKASGMVQISNRPCIYPGCYARARYGLEGARAVYCVEHKKGPMMRLLLVTQEEEKNVSGSSLSAGKKAGDAGKEDASPTADRSSPSGGTKLAARASDSLGKQGPERDGMQEPGSRAAQGMKAAKGGTRPKSKAKQVAVADPADASLESSALTSSSRGAGPPCLSTSTAATQGAGSSAVYATGGAPSAEMRLLRQAREVARFAARSSGSGRRARAPSLKALRAAGLLDEEGTQVLTKAMSDEEVRKSKERRERWRACVTVGLRVGQVLEALTPDGQDDGCPDGMVPGAGRRGTWRKLTAEEILSHGGGNGGALQSTHEDRGLDETSASGEAASAAECVAARAGELATASDVVDDEASATRKSGEIDRNVDGGVVGSDVPSEGIEVAGDSRANDTRGCRKEVNEASMEGKGGRNAKRAPSARPKERQQPEKFRKKPRYGDDSVARSC